MVGRGSFLGLVIVAALCHGNQAELIMEKTPATVLPGVSPSFSLECGYVNGEEAKIVSMSISRRTAGLNNLDPLTQEAEGLVTLSAMTPRLPMPNAQYPAMTVLGQIITFESELGSYIQLLWPNPTVDDLGEYTCQAVVIGEFGQLVTLVATAQVTSGNTMVDRLLLTMPELVATMDTFNASLQELQGRVDTIAAAVFGNTSEVVEPTAEANETTGTTVFPDLTTAYAEATTPADSQELQIERLVAALDSLNLKLEQFNSSIFAIEQRLEQLGTEAPAGNKTETGDVDRPNHVLTFFRHNSSIFFFITGPLGFNSYSAQAVCEKNGLFLAEVQSQAELDAITENLGPLLLKEQALLVGGQREAGADQWLYQQSGTEVTFFGGNAPPVGATNDATCLSLRKSQDALRVEGVACELTGADNLVLCQDYYV